MCKIIYNPKYSSYNLGENHPFNPVRIEILLDLLNELGHSPELITPEPVSFDKLLMVHDKEYIEVVESVSNGNIIGNLEKYGLGTADNPVVNGMADGARIQCGGTLLGAGLILQNKTNKVLQLGGGFHHAHNNFASGFCIYNDLAIAIKEMTNAGLHIAYLDLDVHHGDGVQKIFYSDEKVMTISLHESGEYLFPGTGWIQELGRGMGRSLKINVPIEPFTEGDSYIELINGIVEPALSWFKPDVLIVQAGADAHFSDPLADLMLTTYDFQKIYKKVIELADKTCKGRMLVTLGGGYSISASFRIWAILYLTLFNLEIPDKIPQDWITRWEKKLNKKLPEFIHDILPAYEQIPRKKEIESHNRDTITRLNDLVAQYWI